MIESMTGFGRGIARAEGVQAEVEIRSVNSRFCEISVRLPRALSHRETDVQNLVRQGLSRGRISVTVDVDQMEEEGLPLHLDEAAARALYHLLERLRQTTSIAEPVRLEHLLAFSQVFTNGADADAGAGDATAWPVVQAALAEAVEGIRAMRRQEGLALQTDLEARLAAIEAQLVAVEARAPERVVDARTRLYGRLQEVLGEERINPDRIEQEITLLADRLDVTEECVRLRSHLQVFRSIFADAEPGGRKLNFLLQEMNREVNTIGSKANDAEIAHRAVQMKEELERIREQVQNIE